MADLSGVDPRQLPAAGEALAAKLGQYEDRWGPVAHTISFFAPVVDGEVLPSAPWQALAAGAGRGVELIVGHNRDEYRLFMALAGQLGKVGDVQASEALGVFAPGPDGERAYRGADPDASAERLYELVQTDWRYRMPVLHLADAQVAGGGRVHVYELTWPAPGSGGILGACHGLDVPLLFGTFHTDLNRMYLGPEPPPEAKALGDRFRSAWTTFAATGDPGWPAYDPQRRLAQVLTPTHRSPPTQRRPPGASGSTTGSRHSRCSPPRRRRAAARRRLRDSLGGLCDAGLADAPKVQAAAHGGDRSVHGRGGPRLRPNRSTRCRRCCEPGDRVALEGDNQKQADFLARSLAAVDPGGGPRPAPADLVGQPARASRRLRAGHRRRIDFAYAGPQSVRMAQLIADGTVEVGAIHTYVELYARMFVDLIPDVVLLCAAQADRQGNLFTGPNTEDTPTIAEAAAFSDGVVVVQVNEIVDEVPRVDIPGGWVDVIVQADQPFYMEPLFTRDPRQIGDVRDPAWRCSRSAGSTSATECSS